MTRYADNPSRSTFRMHSTLETILERKRAVLETGKARRLLLRSGPPRKFPPVRSLKARLQAAPFSIIAEVKKASPSAGLLVRRYCPERIATVYESRGAAGISVVTCEPFFLGTMRHLARVRKAVSLPVLQKDFIFDPWQILEGRAHGADAVLLIARILSQARLLRLASFARRLALETVIEVHDHEDVAKALALPDWCRTVLGINNRDLATLRTDIRTSFDLIETIPRDTIVCISESGIRSAQDIESLAARGIRGALVGEFLLSGDPAVRLGQLTRKRRGDGKENRSVRA